MKAVKDFLLKNGFKFTGNAYINNKCSIVIIHNYSVSIMDNDYNVTYSEDLSIYWLIGFLTYYNFIDRNYEKN